MMSFNNDISQSELNSRDTNNANILQENIDSSSADSKHNTTDKRNPIVIQNNNMTPPVIPGVKNVTNKKTTTSLSKIGYLWNKWFQEDLSEDKNKRYQQAIKFILKCNMSKEDVTGLKQNCTIITDIADQSLLKGSKFSIRLIAMYFKLPKSTLHDKLKKCYSSDGNLSAISNNSHIRKPQGYEIMFSTSSRPKKLDENVDAVIASNILRNKEMSEKTDSNTIRTTSMDQKEDITYNLKCEAEALEFVKKIIASRGVLPNKQDINYLIERYYDLHLSKSDNNENPIEFKRSWFSNFYNRHRDFMIYGAYKTNDTATENAVGGIDNTNYNDFHIKLSQLVGLKHDHKFLWNCCINELSLSIRKNDTSTIMNERENDHVYIIIKTAFEIDTKLSKAVMLYCFRIAKSDLEASSVNKPLVLIYDESIAFSMEVNQLINAKINEFAQTCIIESRMMNSGKSAARPLIILQDNDKNFQVNLPIVEELIEKCKFVTLPHVHENINRTIVNEQMTIILEVAKDLLFIKNLRAVQKFSYPVRHIHTDKLMECELDLHTELKDKIACEIMEFASKIFNVKLKPGLLQLFQRSANSKPSKTAENKNVTNYETTDQELEETTTQMEMYENPPEISHVNTADREGTKLVGPTDTGINLMNDTNNSDIIYNENENMESTIPVEKSIENSQKELEEIVSLIECNESRFYYNMQDGSSRELLRRLLGKIKQLSKNSTTDRNRSSDA